MHKTCAYLRPASCVRTRARMPPRARFCTRACLPADALASPPARNFTAHWRSRLRERETPPGPCHQLEATLDVHRRLAQLLDLESPFRVLEAAVLPVDAPEPLLVRNAVIAPEHGGRAVASHTHGRTAVSAQRAQRVQRVGARHLSLPDSLSPLTLSGACAVKTTSGACAYT